MSFDRAFAASERALPNPLLDGKRTVACCALEREAQRHIGSYAAQVLQKVWNIPQNSHRGQETVDGLRGSEVTLLPIEPLENLDLGAEGLK